MPSGQDREPPGGNFLPLTSKVAPGALDVPVGMVPPNHSFMCSNCPPCPPPPSPPVSSLEQGGTSAVRETSTSSHSSGGVTKTPLVGAERVPGETGVESTFRDSAASLSSISASFVSGLDRRKYTQATIIKDGILEKWTNYLGAWRARYFIVEPGVLKYANAPGQPIKETYPLVLCSTRFCPGDSMRLEVEHSHGVLYLRMPSASEKKKWIEALLAAKNAFVQQHPPRIPKMLPAAPFSHTKDYQQLGAGDPVLTLSRGERSSDLCQSSRRHGMSDVTSEEKVPKVKQAAAVPLVPTSGNGDTTPVNLVTSQMGSSRLHHYAGGNEDEKSPMVCLLEHCQSCFRSVQSVNSELRRTQSAFLRLAGQVRDTPFREDVKNTTVRLVETLDHFDAVIRRYLSASRALAIDEQHQRRTLEHSVRSLAKDNYQMKMRLEKVRKEAASVGDITRLILHLRNQTKLHSEALLSSASKDFQNISYGADDTSKKELPLNNSGEFPSKAVTTETGEAMEASTSTEEGRGRHDRGSVLVEGGPSSTLQGLLPCLVALQDIATITRDDTLSEDESQNQASESDEEVEKEESNVKELSGVTAAAPPPDFDDDTEFFDVLDDETAQITERPAPWSSPDILKGEDNNNGSLFSGGTREPTPLRLLRQRQAGSSAVAQPGAVIQRRVVLPKPRTEFNVSLWSILKDCIGKDLSRISLPVYFNEPTSFLQRLAEDFQHADLLNTASQQDKSIQRLVWVAIFSITPCASTLGRTYKPFNPLLGETFEFSHRGFRFLAEQVGHHPPVTAYSAEGDHFNAWGHLVVKTRFTGKSVEVSIPGPAHIVIKRPAENVKSSTADTSNLPIVADHYTLQRCKAIVHNVIFGKLTLEMFGTVLITNHITGDCALIEYLRQGWWSNRELHVVRGVIFDASGRPRYRIGGWWSRELWVEELRPPEDDTCVLQHADTVLRPETLSMLATMPSPGSEHSTPAGNDLPSAVNTNDSAARSDDQKTCSLPKKQDVNQYSPPQFHARNVMDIKINWESLSSVPGSRRVLWKYDLPHPNAALFYEFNQFAMELNDLSPDYDPRHGAAMPPTDSRFRMDQRYLEEGLTEKANAEKNRLEENQRARARLRLAGEADYQPRWFNRAFDPFTLQTGWIPTGEYWTAKKNNDFRCCLDIFG